MDRLEQLLVSANNVSTDDPIEAIEIYNLALVIDGKNIEALNGLAVRICLIVARKTRPATL